MAEAARRWALDHFDQRLVLSRTVSFYRQLLESETSKARAGNNAITGLSESL
jgi:hypothetical protein